MVPKLKHLLPKLCLLVLPGLLLFSVVQETAYAVVNPQSGATGIEGTINAPPPTQAATIAVPSNGQNFTSQPVEVSGLCPSNLLIKLFSNGVFIGAAQCTNGSYSISATLFDGQNQLVAIDYDALGQGGPNSNQVTVTFTAANPSQATPLILTSNYASRGADPGTQLAWPMSISGGVPPYAISVDWGDGSAAELISQPLAGDFSALHTYTKTGVYTVLVKAVDQNNTVAYLQLVGIGNGAIISGTSSSAPGTGAQANTSGPVKTKLAWWPFALSTVFVLLTFWLGRRYELTTLRRRLQQSSEQL